MADTKTRLPRKSTVAGQQARFGATAGLYTIIVLAALVMVNWLANRYNKTYDTTSNKRFTLSNETKKVVDGLKSTQRSPISTGRAGSIPRRRCWTDIRTCRRRSMSTMWI